MLVDSTVIIWALGEKLNATARQIVEDINNDIYLSIASVWEMAIKQSSGKLRLPEDYLAILRSQGVKLLPISVDHAYAVRSLPRLHGDPFDRMLVAQAMIEDLTIMTHDKMIQSYSVPCLMVSSCP